MFLETKSRETVRFIIRVMILTAFYLKVLVNFACINNMNLTGETKSLLLIAIVAVSVLKKDRFIIESTLMAFILRISLVQV